jgi:hypothetical protein
VTRQKATKLPNRRKPKKIRTWRQRRKSTVARWIWTKAINYPMFLFFNFYFEI